jgi:TolB protein
MHSDVRSEMNFCDNDRHGAFVELNVAGLKVAGLILVALFFAATVLLGPASAWAQDGETGNEEASNEAASEEAADSDGIDIDISGSARRTLTPLAVPAAKEPGGDTGKIADTVTKTLRRDLELSGFFKVLPNDSFFFDPAKEGMGASGIKFQNWFEVGAQGLIKSAVRTNGDEVVLDLRLFLVEQGQQAKLNFDASSVKKDEVTDKVHDFANAVLEYYTGQRGIFGSRIAFVRRKGQSKQVYVMDMDGSNRARISQNNSINMLPSFGPGTIYYTSYRDGNPDLWAFKGGKSRKLSSVSGQNTGAAYCGGKLALTLSKGGENSDVYLIDVSSGKIQERLTKHWSIDTSPSFSPDCSQIAFVSGRSGGPQIYVMKADGSNQKRLTYQGSYNSQPSWSPKGNTIAFSARDSRSAFDIFTVDLDGNIERLTQDQGNNSDPSFSPDGRYLTFVSDRGGKGKRIWLMTADGQVQNQITEGTGYQSPAWER